jgi:hypothetical protein
VSGPPVETPGRQAKVVAALEKTVSGLASPTAFTLLLAFLVAGCRWGVDALPIRRPVRPPLRGDPLEPPWRLLTTTPPSLAHAWHLRRAATIERRGRREG